MTMRTFSCKQVSKTVAGGRLPLVLAGCLLCLLTARIEAAPPPLHKLTPIEFFTNTAAHLLVSQLGLGLDHIQLYPTNQYSPAVHRLLQVAANVCDSTTNSTLTPYPYSPSIFRPVFTNDNGAIYIAGYAEVTTTDVLGAAMRDLT